MASSPSLDLSFLRDRSARRRIAALTLCGAVIGLLYGMLAPKWYRSVLTVVPVKQQRSGLSSLLSGEMGGLAAGLDLAGGGAEAPRIAAVLQSIAVSDAVIEKFDLRKRYGEKFQENAREALWEHCSVKTFPKPNLVQLSCEDKDPRFVRDMLAYFADFGNQVFRRVNVSSATEEVRFLDGRVAELRAQAEATATRMREFQEKYRIVDIDTQSKAVVSALASLNAQRITKQLELGYARTYSSSDEATTRQLESELALVEKKLQDLERSPDAAPRADGKEGVANRHGVFPTALAVPRLRADYEGLLRDRKVAEATLIFALERLEAAKANEARDISTFQVLDPPTVPTKKSRPKRALILGGMAFLGFAIAISYEAARAGVLTGWLASQRRGPAKHERPGTSD